MSSILLVDDDFALVEALSRELERLNHKAILTQSADEAIEVLAQMPIDVMVTDLRMRGRDGIELLRRCVELSPSTRTVLMSAYATANDYKEARALGAVEVLSKPFTPAEFAAAIRRAEDFKAGFQADIIGLSLVDLLQVFHHSQRSVTLRVGRIGKVHLREGQIIHAETDTEVGADALLTLLKVERGVLASGAIEPVVRTLTMPFETLLLGTLAHIDEQRDRRPLHIDTDAIIKALTSSPPPASPPTMPSNHASALAVAVAASTPPIMHSPPMATGEMPLVRAEPQRAYVLRSEFAHESAAPRPAVPYSAAPRPTAPQPGTPLRRMPPGPRESPDYLTAGGLILLFAATLMLTLLPSGDPHEGPEVDTPRRPPSAPTATVAPADDVVDPYLGVPMDSAAPTAFAPMPNTPMRMQRARLERAAPGVIVPVTAVPATAVRATAVPATAVPATAVPATAVPATAVPATAVPAVGMPATGAPARAPSTPASSTPASAASTPAVAVPAIAPRKRRRRVVKRRPRPRPRPRPVAKPAPVRVRATPPARPVSKPVRIDAPSVELLD